jgi:SAF domain-containing protein
MVFTDPGAAATTRPARRLQRPSWRDQRLLIGIVLVLASVALGARTMATADHTEPYYAARTTLATGTALTADQVRVVRVRISGGRAAYLRARQPLPAGQVVTRTIGAGELVPIAATAPVGRLALRPVNIPIDQVPAGLAVGGRVDLWSSSPRPEGATGFLPAHRIAERAEVFHVDRAGTGLNAGRGASVQILLPAGELPAVLDALANEARIALLPLPGWGPTGGGA